MILYLNDFCTTNIFKNTNIMQRCRWVHIFTTKSFSMCVLSYDFPGWLPNARWLKPSMEATITTPSLQKNMGQRADCDIIYYILSALIQRPSIYHTICKFSQTDPLVDRTHRSSWTWSRIPSMRTTIADLKTARIDDVSPQSFAK